MDFGTSLPPYFAYGSNLNPSQMARRCPGHRVIGRATLEDHVLRFRGHGEDWGGAVATVEGAPGERVHGVVFDLTAEHYEALDRYEEWKGDDAPDNLYDRVERVVVGEDGIAMRVLTYVMTKASIGPPSRRYVDAILAGMEHHGLPQESIDRLRAVTTVPS